MTTPNDRVLHHRLVVAYHGTSRDLGEAILLGKAELQARHKTWHWLGQGIYFWEHGPSRAYEWARAHCPDPYVLGAYINLGRCLDLTDTSGTRILAGAFEVVRSMHERLQKPLPTNLAGRGAVPGERLLRPLDCAVIDAATKVEDARVGMDPAALGPFQTVRGVFEEGAEAFPGACVRERTHVQIAVRDGACVLGYFRPV